jgi:Exonuclease III
LESKKEWNTHFEAYIRNLDKKKPIIWMGDLNVAPSEIGSVPCSPNLPQSGHLSRIPDLSNPKRNWNKTAGYTEVETVAFNAILEPPVESALDHKFVDIWRKLHPTLRHYTYFSYRFNCRMKGLGWRLDMSTCNALCDIDSVESFYFAVVLSERIVDRVRMVGSLISNSTMLQVSDMFIFSVRLGARYMGLLTIVLWLWRLRVLCKKEIVKFQFRLPAERSITQRRVCH